MTEQARNTQQLKDLKRICDDAGIKLTHQRIEIFKELTTSKDHPSAERIHQRLQKSLPTIAIDTVYRTLATFEELGILKKLHIMNERTLFDANMEQHHHFVCSRCKSVQDIYWPDFDNSLLPQRLSECGEIQSRHLELHGLCKNCLNTAKLE